MIDESTIWLNIAQNIEPVRNNVRESFEYCGLWFNPHQRDKPILTYHSTLGNLNLTIRTDTLYIRNSLHKYHTGGENYSDFKKSDLHETILDLSEVFQTDVFKANITKTSLSVNLETSFKPMDFIRNVSDYKNSPMQYMRSDYNRGEIRGKRADFSHYKVKLYIKSHEGKKDLLRLEKTSKNSAYFKKGKTAIRLNTLEDFFNSDFDQQYTTHLLESFNHFNIMNNALPFELTIEEKKYWFIYTHPSEEAKQDFIKEHGRAYREGIKRLKQKLKSHPEVQKLFLETQAELSRKIDYLLHN